MKKSVLYFTSGLMLSLGIFGLKPNVMASETEIAQVVFDDIEPNDSYDQAQTLVFGKTYHGFLSFFDYTDHYYFELTEKTHVKFELESEVESVLVEISDGGSNIFLNDVFDREGDQLINKEFEYTLDAGKYYVRINHNRALAPDGSYSLRVSAPLFSDLGQGWWTSHVEEFVSLGFVSGYSDGMFKPQNPITRAEFVKIVNKSFGLDKLFTPVTNLPFTDLDSQWKKDELKLALGAGYITPSNEFRHNDPINRQEAAKIVGVLLENKIISDGSVLEFTDTDEIAPWAKEYVGNLVQAGVLSKNESFRPKDSITRVEAVKMLNIARGL